MKIVIDTKIIGLILTEAYGPTSKIRIRASQRLKKIRTPKPITGICHGCGKNLYNGLDVCSLACLDVVNLQYSGY